jgi:hypothetical protein
MLKGKTAKPRHIAASQAPYSRCAMVCRFLKIPVSPHAYAEVVQPEQRHA